MNEEVLWCIGVCQREESCLLNGILSKSDRQTTRLSSCLSVLNRNSPKQANKQAATENIPSTSLTKSYE